MAAPVNIEQKLPKGVRAVSPYTTSQQNLYNQLGPLGFAGIQKNLDISPILSETRRQFQQETLPSIAERFTAFGADQTSGKDLALLQAGSGLDSMLGALQSQHQLALLPFFQNLLQMGLQPQYDFFQKPQQQSGIANILSSLGQAAGAALPAYFMSGGNPFAALLAGGGSLLGRGAQAGAQAPQSGALSLLAPNTLRPTLGSTLGQTPLPSLFPNLSSLSMYGGMR